MDDPSTIFQVFRDGSSWVNVSCSRTHRSDAGEARTNLRPLGLGCRYIDRYIHTYTIRWMVGWIDGCMDGWMDRKIDR